MVRALLAFLLLALASNSSAFFDPPTTAPANATAGQMVSVNFRHGVCDAVLGAPDDGEIAIANNVVSLLLDGIHSEDSMFCIYPVANVTFRIGAFSEGEYVVNVYHRYQGFFGDTQTVLVGSTTFTVTGAAVHHAIPSSSVRSTFVLVVAIALIGIWVARHRAVAVFVLASASLIGPR